MILQVSLLLGAKANAAQVCGDGTTSLHAVCRTGREGCGWVLGLLLLKINFSCDQVIAMLIDAGVPTTNINGFGSTALHDACMNARFPIECHSPFLLIVSK